MTQQEQAEFTQNLEVALAWMRATQERLRVSDNTQGPMAALEARLRETEEIRESEHEGRLKMDVALVAADNLLRDGDEVVKRETHAKLKELKGLWEETSTYIIHCHSRVEWVWLHWSEYLKAHEEFGLWLGKMRGRLEPQLEMQLELQGKLWQLEHHRVLLSDAHAQEPLLGRLLEEAFALHSRTEDPSVGPEVQLELQEAYDHIRDRTQERVALLQKIVEDHQAFDSCVQKFQAWLAATAKELDELCESEQTTADKLQALQGLYDSVASAEKTLQHVEKTAEAVKARTSPGGAEAIARDTECLRQAWDKLRQQLLLEQEGLRGAQRSAHDYEARVARIRAAISQLHGLILEQRQRLESKAGERTEEAMVALWRKYSAVHGLLAAEEPGIENLKVELKELFHFCQDTGPLSADVLAVIKEYQGIKNRAFKLLTEEEVALGKVLQDPLQGCDHWRLAVTQVLEESEKASEFSHVGLLVHSMEKLLKYSLQVQERLSQLQVKGELLASVLGPERAERMHTELSTALKDRERLHGQLAQRKSHLQDLLLRSKNFGDMYESILKRLGLIKEGLNSAYELQPDILAKRSLCERLMVMKKDLEECEAHMTALESLVSSSLMNRRKFDELCMQWNELYKAVRVKITENERNVVEHENFHEVLLTVEKWLMIMRQKLESFCSSDGEWSVDNRRPEAERAQGEFPEKELQLQKTESLGQIVLAKTSEEGRVHIRTDLKRIRESWISLNNLSRNVFRLLDGEAPSGGRDHTLTEEVHEQTGPDRDLFVVQGEDRFRMHEPNLKSGDYSSEKAKELSFKSERSDDGQSFRQDVGPRGKGFYPGQDLRAGGDGTAVGSSITHIADTVDIGVGGKAVGSSDSTPRNDEQMGEMHEKLAIRPEGFDAEVGFRQDHGGEGLYMEQDLRITGDGVAKEGLPRTSVVVETLTGTGGRTGVDAGAGSEGLMQSPEGSRKPGSEADVERFGQTVGFSGPSGFCEFPSELDAGEMSRHSRGVYRRRVEGTEQSEGSEYPMQWQSEVHVPSAYVYGFSGKCSKGSPALSKWGNTGGLYDSEKTHNVRSSGVIMVEDESPGSISAGTDLSVDGSLHHRMVESLETQFQGDLKLQKEFESWLKMENNKLDKIVGQKGQQSAEQLKEKEQALKDLRSRVGWGQSQLQKLLASWGVGTAVAEVQDLEDLRYRWMLYKSKLKDAEALKAPVQRTESAGVLSEEPIMIGKKRSGFLWRVCCAALPLQLLLLALLLLAFLLPLTDKSASCSLANNFARSFNIMLRYHGPPPT